MHSSLKKGLSWILSYGIIFSLPAWALLTRVAHAGGTPDDNVQPKTSKITKPDSGKKKIKDESHGELESEEPIRKESKGQPSPRSTDCSNEEFLMKATDSSIQSGRRCDNMKTPPLDTRKCWYQFFELLGAAQSNALIENNSLEAGRASGQAAASTISNGNYLIPSLFPTNKTKSVGPTEDELKNVFSLMSDDTIKNKKLCCQQLVQQAEKLSSWILAAEGKESKVKPNKVNELIEKQRSSCDQKRGMSAAAAAAYVPPAPSHAPQTQEAPEKKKSIWPAVFWGLAAGALLFFLLYKRKKRNSTPPPTPVTPTPNPPTTGGLTYPALTTSTGRDITTGGSSTTTGTLTYPSDITGTTTGRDITTGGSGTVTGSTTATPTTSTSTTTGSTTASPIYPDLTAGDPSRTTSGTTRPISK
jgi:hypothetical protein